MIEMMLLAGGGALIVTVLCAFVWIPVLRRLKMGQSILEVGPNWHKTKQGTPTMGGFVFMVGITAAALVAGIGVSGGREVLLALLPAWIYGIIGFVDDFAKIRNKRNQGLTALQKLLLQLAAAAAFLALLRYLGILSTEVYIPFVNITLPLPWIFYISIGILFITGMDNAVNLTDGIDGLCTGVTLPIAALFTVIARQMELAGIAVLGAALLGGLLGFLLFNFHPAKVFMGDTGSLFLGGLLCGIVFVLDMPLILIVCGLVFLLEMFSVILQVGYFKLSGGKRLFKMAPVHHHFEMSGWSEVKIFFVFAFATALLCVLSYLGVAGRL